MSSFVTTNIVSPHCVYTSITAKLSL